MDNPASANNSEETQDPQEMGARPPFPRQAQAFPSLEASMEPLPDHGEESYQGSGLLEGKVALITGGDSGVGRAIALAYAREGADVLIAYFNEHADAEASKVLVESAGRRALTYALDIRDEESCKRLIQYCLDEFGQIDILVNNAGYQMHYAGFGDIPTEDLHRHFETNMYGMFYLSRAAVATMKPGSVIINTASIEAHNPTGELVLAAASYGGVIAFSKGLAKLLIKDGIRVNVVALGPVWTPMIAYSYPIRSLPRFGDQTPIGRPAQPVEVAPVYVFLASGAASYITGAVYEVAGGLSVTG